jgi:hypothetical protein
MRAYIEVKDRKEAVAIRRGLQDPVTRATVKVVGTLLQLPTDRARQRVLGFVVDKLNEERKMP